MDSLAIIVLAAGLGKRMGSDEPKVCFPLGARPLIQHVLSTAQALKPQKTVVVVGKGREKVERAVREGQEQGLYRGDLQFVVQEQQRGVGDAVKCALPALKDFTGTVVILYGDVPLTKTETLQGLLDLHKKRKATLSLITLLISDPQAYGRIVRSKTTGEIEKIVEFKDCSDAERAIREINAGLYAVDSAFLKPALESLKNDNAQKEFYLTDIIAKAVQEGQTLSALVCSDTDEFIGVNTRWELSRAEKALRARTLRALVDSGVHMEDPETVYLDAGVQIEPGAVLGPQLVLKGSTKICKGAKLDGQSYLENTLVEEDAHVKLSVRAEGAQIGKAAQVGPFAHLRPGTVLGADVKVGNFVETKKALLAAGAKASHLTYLGDCTVGKNANIGAGTITCNYDGYNKFETSIGDGAFIGSNTSLVAPVQVGDGAVVGAGSVITKDVAADSLAVSRATQIEKKDWAKKRRLAAKK